MSALNTAELTSELGAYCRQNGEQLYTEMLLGLDIVEHLEVIVGVIDEEPLINLSIGDVVQPFRQAFEPLADRVNFKPRILKVQPFKIDLTISPKQLHKTWLGKMKRPGANPYNLPFEAEIMNEIIRKGKNEIAMKVVFKGDHDAAGVTATAVADGFIKILEDLVTATDITATTITALTSTNAVTEFEKVVAAIPSEYLSFPMKMYVSTLDKRKYEQSYRASFGALPYNTEFKKTFIEGTNIEIVGDAGMQNNRLIIAPMENMVYGVDLLGDMDSLEIEKRQRNIDIMLDATVGMQIKNTEYVWYGKTV